VRFTHATGDASDMVLSFVGSTGSLTLDNQIDDGREWGVDLIRFSDGSTWDVAELNSRYFAGVATAGDDTIAGSPESDVIVGLGGNDILRGGGGLYRRRNRQRPT
jgi:Ca2+-binding RTX toxin-like protein